MSAGAGPALRAVAADPRSDPRWRDLVSAGAGSLFTSPPWIAAVCDCYGFTPQARMLLDDEGRATDAFAWVRVTDARGDRLSSLPFSDRAEPVAADPARWRLLARDALATGLPLTVRCLEGSPALDDPAAAHRAEAAWHGTPLDAPLDELRARLSPAARRNVRAASRSGVRVVEGTDLASVRRLHRLHVGLRKRKYRLLAQPVALFERIRDAFAADDGILVLLAYAGDEPVAGAMYLVWDDVLYYKFGASAAAHLSLRPNEAIAWHALRWATERGLRLLDWGLSDLDQPGLLRFKRKWGALERRIVTARWGAASADPASRAIGETLSELTRLLTDDSVPDDITERAGAVLYRYFC